MRGRARVAYLASPIDRVPGESAGIVSKMKAEAAELLHFAGFIVYDPAAAWTVGKGQYEPDGRLWQINEEAMRGADVFLAVFPAEADSVGVPMEIEMARRWMPCAVVGNRQWSFALRAQGIELFSGRDGVAEAVEYLDLADTESQQITDVNDLEVNVYPTLRVKALHTDAVLPVQKHVGDAGLDLHVVASKTIPGKTWMDIPCGVAVEMPPGTWGMILGRSSTFRKRGLEVITGVIDSGYRGELFAAVFNPGKEEKRVEAGERIAQMILFPDSTTGVRTEWVNTLGTHVRGTDGFGSTGE